MAKEQTYQIAISALGINLTFKRFANGSYAYLNSSGFWSNVPSGLAETIIQSAKEQKS